MTTELRMYSTVAGELPSLVRNQTPKCFVEYEQYLEALKAQQETSDNLTGMLRDCLSDMEIWAENFPDRATFTNHLIKQFKKYTE